MVAFTGVIYSLPLYPSTGGLGAADGWCLSFTVGFLWVLPLSLQCAWTWTRGINCVLQAFQLDVAKNDFQLPPWHPTACTTICIPTRVAQLQEKWEKRESVFVCKVMAGHSLLLIPYFISASGSIQDLTSPSCPVVFFTLILFLASWLITGQGKI